MTGTKTLRYDTTVLDARALADALEAEEKAGWEVAEAAYDGTDFVVTFERQENPPKGWKKLIPLGMQVPPVPVDDYAAIVIGRKYLKDNK